MRALVLIIFLLVAQTGFSQQWCPPGATWTYGYFIPFTGNGYIQMAFEKDTILSGQSCKKISGYEVIAYDWIPNQNILDTSNIEPIFTFSTTDTVFFWHEAISTFSPGYFFDTQTGDTIAHIEFNYNYTAQDDTVLEVIDTTGYIQVHNKMLRYYVSRPICKSSDFCYPTKVVEGIGAMDNFIKPLLLWGSDPQGFYLRCYQDDSLALYQTSTSITCDYIYTSIRDEDVRKTVNLFPNPAMHSFQLQLSETPPTETYLQLYDATGRMIKQERIIEALTTIQRVGIASGIYFWQVHTAGKITGRGKGVFE